MLSGVVNVICEIAIFMICAGAIVNFRPKPSYEKYLKMLVSSMVLVQFFIAIGGFFFGEWEAALKEHMTWFTEDTNVFFVNEDLEFRMDVEEEPIEEKQENSPIVIEIPPIVPISISDIGVGSGE